MSTTDSGGCVLILDLSLVLTIVFGDCCLLIEIVQTIDFGDCPLLIGTGQTILFSAIVYRLELLSRQLISKTIYLPVGINNNCVSSRFRVLSMNWN